MTTSTAWRPPTAWAASVASRAAARALDSAWGVDGLCPSEPIAGGSGPFEGPELDNRQFRARAHRERGVDLGDVVRRKREVERAGVLLGVRGRRRLRDREERRLAGQERQRHLTRRRP